jgi:hypothetical protein
LKIENGKFRIEHSIQFPDSQFSIFNFQFLLVWFGPYCGRTLQSPVPGSPRARPRRAADTARSS